MRLWCSWSRARAPSPCNEPGRAVKPGRGGGSCHHSGGPSASHGLAQRCAVPTGRRRRRRSGGTRGLGRHRQRGGSPPHRLPCLPAEPSHSPRGVVLLAALLLPVFPSRSAAASPAPTPTPKLFSWAAKSSSQMLGNILVRLLYNAAVNYVLTCLFLLRSV